MGRADILAVREAECTHALTHHRVGKIEQGVAHRAARLYRFDRQAYRDLQKRGFRFEL